MKCSLRVCLQLKLTYKGKGISAEDSRLSVPVRGVCVRARGSLRLRALMSENAWVS